MTRSRAICLLTLALGLPACSSPPPEPAAPVPVQVGTVSTLSQGEGLKYSAEIAPSVQVDVAFRTDGYVTSIGQLQDKHGSERILQPGDAVTEGTELARIEDQQYQDTLQQARASLTSAEAALRKGQLDYQRASALYDKNSITSSDYDSAVQEYQSSRAAVENARAQVDEAELKLRDTQLQAPFDGVVIQRNIEVGSLVHSGSTGFQLAKLKRVKAVFGVPDVILKTISLGSELAINTTSVPGREFTGTVSQIDPAADPRNRVFSVSLDLDNSEGLLKPGMIASLVVDKSRLVDDVLVVPISAIVQDPASGDFAVFLVEQKAADAGVAQRRVIGVGQVIGDRIAITSGVQLNDTIVTLGAGQLADNQAIIVIP